jgi:hypothetical protein
MFFSLMWNLAFYSSNYRTRERDEDVLHLIAFCTRFVSQRWTNYPIKCRKSIGGSSSINGMRTKFTLLPTASLISGAQPWHSRRKNKSSTCHWRLIILWHVLAKKSKPFNVFLSFKIECDAEQWEHPTLPMSETLFITLAHSSIANRRSAAINITQLPLSNNRIESMRMPVVPKQKVIFNKLKWRMK